MSEPKLISPLLDNFAIGGAISSHHGVSCYPAMENNFDDKYIVKVISVPASQTQMDALLLTGAYSSMDAALSYFQSLADEILEEVRILDNLSSLEGFLPYRNSQCLPKEDGTGFDVYLLSPYRRTLSRQFSRAPLTHLDALNLGLDICAALAVCRRSGYLYVDLKPNNIYITQDKRYYIGDLGFAPLDFLQYTSLPEKYMSAYTAPEISDAFSSLNTTIDIYALGLILYQVYNNGSLPVAGEDGVFPAPEYADYEMAEIIMKALSANPEERWQDPTQMGQALVSYMQRNGAHDTPIIPPAPAAQDEPTAPVTEEMVEDVAQDEVSETPIVEEVVQNEESETPIVEEVTSPAESSTEAPEEPGTEVLEITEVEPEAKNGDEDYINLSFLDEDIDQDVLDTSYEQVTDEVSSILLQADDLATHQVPDPVVAPELIEVPVPEPIVAEEETPADGATEEEAREDAEADVSAEDVPADTDVSDEDGGDIEEAAPRTRNTKWLKAVLAVLIIAGILFGGYYYYNNYYLQTIDKITVQGQEDHFTVILDTDARDDILFVVCTDTHGNPLTASVENGKATFTNLLPNTTYSISVKANGFRKLIGQIDTSYSTPIQTKIVQFNAVTGAEDGSVILGFTVEGPDSEKWSISYGAEGEEKELAAFPGHTVTLNGLTIGKEYTFTLIPETPLYITGTKEITYTASKLVYAQDLKIISCVDGKLIAQWSAPQDATVTNWVARCNGEGYTQTITTTEPMAIFEGVDSAKAYSVDVIAAGMSVSQRTGISENSVTISNMQFDTSDPTKLSITWDANREIPSRGWVLNILVDGVELYSPKVCKTNSVVLDNVIPGSTYSFTFEDSEGTDFLGLPVEFQYPAAETFACNYEGKPITAADITFKMCKRPDLKSWNRYHLYKSDYTNTFTIGQKAGFVLHMEKRYGNSVDDYTLTYVIKTKDGVPVSVDSQYTIWNNIWYVYYSHRNIPRLPTTPGEYIIEVYFNGALANTQAFTMQ